MCFVAARSGKQNVVLKTLICFDSSVPFVHVFARHNKKETKLLTVLLPKFHFPSVSFIQLRSDRSLHTHVLSAHTSSG